VVQTAIKAQGSFTAFAPRGYTSALNYANVTKAALFDVNPNATAAEIRIPFTGVSQNVRRIEPEPAVSSHRTAR
jgi:hypothetical protein